MGKYLIDYSSKYFEDIKKHKMSGNNNAYKKITSLILEIENHPREGTGHPEHLKHYPNVERWSRHINKKHRLVYDIEENFVIYILSAWGHYEDN